MQKTIKVNNKEINKIGIGTWMMGGGWSSEYSIAYADYDHEDEEIKAIRYSIEKGQNHIDTAQMYGAGHCEEVVGKAIKGLNRENLFIASKIFKANTKKSAVLHSTEDTLRKLQIDYLDLIYIHSPNNPFPMEEYMAGLSNVVDKGLAKGLAVSNFNLEQLKKAQSLSKHPILANQMLYNIIERSDVTEEMVEYCVSNNILLVAYRPVERKLLADNCEISLVLDLAKKYNKTPAQIALNWLVSKPNVVAIPKATSPAHIEENLQSSAFDMETSDIKLLDGYKK